MTLAVIGRLIDCVEWLEGLRLRTPLNDSSAELQDVVDLVGQQSRIKDIPIGFITRQ